MLKKPSSFLPHISLRLRLVPALVLAISLLVSWAALQRNRAYQQEELRNAFEFRAREVAYSIAQRMDAYEQVLRGVQSFFAVSEAVTAQEFRTYIKMLRLDENYPGFQGISYAHYIRHADRAAQLAAIRRLGYAEQAIRPEGIRTEYVPVIAVEPATEKNRRVLGYDTFSEPVRRKAMERSRDLGMAALTGKLRLMQESDRHYQAGCLMFLPVYRRGTAATTVAGRQETLVGWVAASFRMDDLMTGILGERSKALDIEIFDGSDISAESMMYDDDTVLHASETGPERLQSRRQIEVAGHIWTIVASSRAESLRQDGLRGDTGFMLVGIGVSLLLTLITCLLVAGRIKALKAAQSAQITSHALKEAEKLAQIGHFDYDPRSNTTFWSEGLERIWGFEPGNRPRRFEEFLATVHPDDLQIIIDSDADKSWHETSSEFRIIRKDGEIRHIYSHGYREFDRNGAIVRVFGIDQDITGRKLSEEIVLRSRNYYLQLLENFPALIWRANPEGSCDYFNHTWLSFTGRSLEQEQGDGWTTGVHPDDLSACLATFHSAFLKREPFRMEYRLRRHDGCYQWITDYGQPLFDENGQFAGYIGSCYNIDAQKTAELALKQAHEQLEQRIQERTSELSLANSQLRQEIVERKRIEEELRASRAMLDKAQQQARLGCWSWDMENDTVTWSAELYHLFGMDPRQPPPAYAEHHKLFTPESYNRLDHAIACTMATGIADKLNMDMEIIRSDGSHRHCLGHGEAVKDAQGRIVQLNGTLQDITEYRQLEQQLFEARKLESIGQLVSGVAHEVRNPLNAIMSVTEALFREKEIEDNPDYAPYLQHIKSQVTRLAHLMNDLLDLGKPIPAGNLQALPLQELCRETIALWPGSSGQAARTVTFTSGFNAELFVRADAIKLQQAIINLLDNAAQNSPEGSEITFTLVASHSSRNACILIRDAGSGIPEDRIERVFEPFVSNRRGGTGLGLSLVKHYVENMGGTVQIKNNHAAPGCTAEICVPITTKDKI